MHVALLRLTQLWTLFATISRRHNNAACAHARATVAYVGAVNCPRAPFRNFAVNWALVSIADDHLLERGAKGLCTLIQHGSLPRFFPSPTTVRTWSPVRKLRNVTFDGARPVSASDQLLELVALLRPIPWLLERQSHAPRRAAVTSGAALCPRAPAGQLAQLRAARRAALANFICWPASLPPESWRSDHPSQTPA